MSKSQTENPYARLGEQVTRLLRALAYRKNISTGQTMSYIAACTNFSRDTIYDWRQGARRPPAETIEILARMDKAEAGLDRLWGESLLRAARYPEPESLVHAIWGLKEIYQNLPRPDHSVFVGRQAEMSRLLQRLSFEHSAPLISIDGMAASARPHWCLKPRSAVSKPAPAKSPTSRCPRSMPSSLYRPSSKN